ncbi:hypothetical protein JCM14469_34030 [Desulfatiferula olefinivorans]
MNSLRQWWSGLDRRALTIVAATGFTALTICFVALLFLYPYSRLDRPADFIDLAGSWTMSADDRPEYKDPDFDDSSWETVTLPGSFIERQIALTGRHEGVCWFRKRIRIHDSLTFMDLGLILGRIANADQTFFNGERIGETGLFPPDEFSMWNHPRSYRIPERIIRPSSDNLLAIRVSYDNIGDIRGKLFITDPAGWNSYRASDTYTQVIMGYVTIAMGAALLLIFLFFFVRRPEYGEYLFYCLQLIFGLPVVLEVCNLWPVYPSNDFRFLLLGFAWVALNVAHPIFLHRIYGFKRVTVERALWAYLALILFIGVVLTTPDKIRFHGLLLIVSALCVGFYNFSCHITALIRKSPYARLFSFFGVTVVLCAIHDGFAYLEKFCGLSVSFLGYTPETMVFHVGAIFLYTGTALVLVTRFITVSDEVESLNESLENFIIENSLLSEKLEKTLSKRPAVSITGLAEEKLKTVIQFINDNYLDEISREDLANTVGVHPDSLGKQFKKYTGRKLGDYIYELRINEAARRLREEDTNIIDIAFDVGFESVRTFNRIFPKFMNTTPNNYRKIHQEKRGGRNDADDGDRSV